MSAKKKWLVWCPTGSEREAWWGRTEREAWKMACDALSLPRKVLESTEWIATEISQ